MNHPKKKWWYPILTHTHMAYGNSTHQLKKTTDLRGLVAPARRLLIVSDNFLDTLARIVEGFNFACGLQKLPHVCLGCQGVIYGLPGLVNVYITMENHHFLMGKSTISMAIFNSYVCLPEGNCYNGRFKPEFMGNRWV